MNYSINNNYGYNKDFSYLDEVIQETLIKEHCQNAVFSIIFVNEEEIKKINKMYRNIDKITDVISFALEDGESILSDLRVLGDIYICIPKMINQAIEYNHSEKRELSFLTVHGLLHLLGYDHTKSIEEEKIMFKKQNDILENLNIIE